ncbi:MAG TPA: hypothetical protein PLD59_04610 [Tepidisphaeraceae bacterium]|nr:hypothetical protein [Tepidisphaeraceae bacterium]
MPAKIRQGDVYFLPNCPPLDGGSLKDRRVIVVTPTDLIADDNDLIAVGVSTSPPASGEPAVEMLNTQHDPRARTGFTKPCWAILRWTLRVHVASLGKKAGHVRGERLARVVTGSLNYLANSIQVD